MKQNKNKQTGKNAHTGKEILHTAPEAGAKMNELVLKEKIESRETKKIYWRGKSVTYSHICIEIRKAQSSPKNRMILFQKILLCRTCYNLLGQNAQNELEMAYQMREALWKQPLRCCISSAGQGLGKTQVHVSILLSDFESIFQQTLPYRVIVLRIKIGKTSIYTPS